MRTIFKLLSPALIPVGVGLLYTYLNIGRRMFVEHLGCGCHEGFNTNCLSLTFSGLLFVLTGSVCWIASRTISIGWRIFYLALSGIAFWEFFLRFMYYNMWA